MNKFANTIKTLRNVVGKLTKPETRQRICTALTLGKTIIGATVMETLKKDPRKINCQVTFMSLNFGTDQRLYDVQMLQRLTKDVEPVEVYHSQLTAFGILSDELKAQCFHEDRIMDVDLSYPIIVDYDTGLVLDGRHRLAKSKALGQDKIMVIPVNMNSLPYAHKDIFNNMTFVNV